MAGSADQGSSISTYAEKPLWPLYKKVRRYVRRHLGYPNLPIDDGDVDVYLAQNIDDLLDLLREIYTADVIQRRSTKPLFRMRSNPTKEFP